jgi:hypothetical protein
MHEYWSFRGAADIQTAVVLYAEPLEHVKRIAIPLEHCLECWSMSKKKNPAAVALGRLGGRKSAQGRMEKISPEQRKEIARNAAKARWTKEGKKR